MKMTGTEEAMEVVPHGDKVAPRESMGGDRRHTPTVMNRSAAGSGDGEPLLENREKWLSPSISDLNLDDEIIRLTSRREGAHRVDGSVQTSFVAKSGCS